MRGELSQKALGQRIRHLREQRHWTQHKLAEKVGIAEVGHIGKWERGEVFPSPHNLISLTRAFNIRLRDLFTFPEQPDL
ncbi:MAG: hypothetical protein AUG51_20830 [Acidobacteria bacterium 13_1_20CM_3_53_8]|nr:MAG: hypothetical protein AUG51_20830 [Acidobacteria bacterium 13_1_20CM_3_53_8]